MSCAVRAQKYSGINGCLLWHQEHEAACSPWEHQEALKGQEVAMGYQPQGLPSSYIHTSPARLCLLKAPWEESPKSPQTTPPTGKQVFKHTSLGGHFRSRRCTRTYLRLRDKRWRDLPADCHLPKHSGQGDTGGTRIEEEPDISGLSAGQDLTCAFKSALAAKPVLDRVEGSEGQSEWLLGTDFVEGSNCSGPTGFTFPAHRVLAVPLDNSYMCSAWYSEVKAVTAISSVAQSKWNWRFIQDPFSKWGKVANEKENPYSWWAFLEPSAWKAVGVGTVVRLESESRLGWMALGALWRVESCWAVAAGEGVRLLFVVFALFPT